MKENEIVEGDRLIDEFYTGKVQKAVFEYHKSWEWLMDVVEKIESLNMGFNVIIETASCHIFKDASWGIEGGWEKATWEAHTQLHNGNESKVEMVWQNIVQFIKWYKIQTPQQ